MTCFYLDEGNSDANPYKDGCSRLRLLLELFVAPRNVQDVITRFGLLAVEVFGRFSACATDLVTASVRSLLFGPVFWPVDTATLELQKVLFIESSALVS